MSDRFHRLTNRQILVANGLLGLLFALGLAIVALSFAGWIKLTSDAVILCFLGCGPDEKTGDHVTRITAVGDGYATAALGMLISSLAVLVLAKRPDTRSMLITTVVVSGVAIFILGASSVAAPTAAWGGRAGETGPLYAFEPTTQLYALTVFGGAAALIAGILLGSPESGGHDSSNSHSGAPR
jgi:hypothetical protein